jgi:hypothetical protein
LGRNTETHNEQNARCPTPGRAIIVHILPSKNLTSSVFALANRNAKAGVKPTPALIETTANPKRCGFGLSRKKSDQPGPDELQKTLQNQWITRFS